MTFFEGEIIILIFFAYTSTPRSWYIPLVYFCILAWKTLSVKPAVYLYDQNWFFKTSFWHPCIPLMLWHWIPPLWHSVGLCISPSGRNTILFLCFKTSNKNNTVWKDFEKCWWSPPWWKMSPSATPRWTTLSGLRSNPEKNNHLFCCIYLFTVLYCLLVPLHRTFQPITIFVMGSSTALLVWNFLKLGCWLWWLFNTRMC